MHAARLRRSRVMPFIRWSCSRRAVGLLWRWGRVNKALSSVSWLVLAQRPLKIGCLFCARRLRRLVCLLMVCKNGRHNVLAAATEKSLFCDDEGGLRMRFGATDHDNVKLLVRRIGTRRFCSACILCLLLPYLVNNMARTGQA
jgi:hypothetical protein